MVGIGSRKIGNLPTVALDLVGKITLKTVRTEERPWSTRLNESSAVPAGHVKLAIRRIHEDTGRVGTGTLNTMGCIVLRYDVRVVCWSFRQLLFAWFLQEYKNKVLNYNTIYNETKKIIVHDNILKSYYNYMYIYI